MSQAPWSWRPDLAPWARSLRPALEAWRPEESLELDADAIRGAMCEAVEAGAGWLRHPFLNPLTSANPENRARRDVQFAVWVAANSAAPLGSVAIREPIELWTAAGDETMAPGTHRLAKLGAIMRERASPVPLPLDPWCGSIGYPLENSWASAFDSPDETARGREIVGYCRTFAAVGRLMPSAMEWILCATRVVIPMLPREGGVFRSGSQADLPGLVYTDLHGGPAQILETVVHETAHNHLYVAEAQGPLVDPGHHGRYHSPLRPEPRPLRGILLACHALAYICAAFRDAVEGGVMGESSCGGVVRDLRKRRDEARGTLEANHRHLTPLGRDFFARTAEVCDYGNFRAG